jgi:16S rRNA (guanine(966)-N(2))-methyltransferase RsmD
MVLSSPLSKSVRPTTDRVKETLYNILQSRNAIQGATVLDLFCGSGALGIEAASRHASNIIFVDNDRDNIQLTKANTAKTKLEFAIYCMDWELALNKFSNQKVQFDLILLDPPYNKGIEDNVLTKIVQLDILSDNGYIALECHKDTSVIDLVNLLTLQCKSYRCGNTTLYLIWK